MISRRQILSFGIGTTALMFLPSLQQLAIPTRWITLPGLDGPFEVQLPRHDWATAYAQGFFYNSTPYEQAAVFYQQQMQMQMQYWAARQAWLEREVWRRQMQAHRWAQEQHRRAMEDFMRRNPSYQYANRPTPFPHVESVYAVALDRQQTPVLFGANREGKPVEIKHTVKGASAAFNLLKNIGQEDAERSVGPQTSEVKAQIELPNDGEFIPARGYETANGVLAVSTDNYETRDGRTGAIAKYETRDGERYMIV